MISRFVLLAFLLFSTLGLVPALAAPARPAASSGLPSVQVQVHDVGEQIKLVMDWKGQVAAHVRSALGGHGQMVIRLSPARLEGGNRKLPVRRGLIGVIEAVQIDATTVRILIPVMAPPVYTSSTRGPAGGLQLLISTMEVDRGASSPAPQPAATASPSPAPQPAATASPSPAPQPAATASPSPAPQPAATASPSPAPQPAATASPSPAPQPAAMASPSPAPQPAAMASPSPAPQPAAMASPSPAPQPAAMASPSPAPRTAAAPGSQALPDRSYSMVFTGQDLAEILSNLAEDLGLRPVLDPAVKGPVATTLANLDAASALEAILRTQSTPFAFEVKDGQLRVFPSRPRPQTSPAAGATAPAPAPQPAVTGARPEVGRDPTRAQAFFPIQGRKAATVVEGLKSLYPQALFQVDERLNVILVEAEPNQLEQIRKVLSVFAQP